MLFRSHMKKFLLTLSVFLLSLLMAHGTVKLPATIGSHMVVQHSSTVKLWGWADGKRVKITPSWSNKTYQTPVDENGMWQLEIETPEAGFTPYSITFDDGNKTMIDDVLAGEVWICSGQSNMEMHVMGLPGQPTDKSLETLLNAHAYRNKIRFITVPRTMEETPRIDFEGEWQPSSPENTRKCSAAAYFFAQQLSNTLDVPVGLVINSWGGSSIEAWMPETVLSTIDGVDWKKMKNPKRSVSSRVQCLYNSMLWPVKEVVARGFLWYQGEANLWNSQLYAPDRKSVV